MVKRLIYALALAMAVSLFASGACAQLTSMSYGFPTIVQSSNAVAFNYDTANAVDFQTVDINFPSFLGGGTGFAFPSISQTSLQEQTVCHTSYSQSNNYAAMSYPFMGIGAAGIPGFGF
jgi:hypothetical protein